MTFGLSDLRTIEQTPPEQCALLAVDKYIYITSVSWLIDLCYIRMVSIQM